MTSTGVTVGGSSGVRPGTAGIPRVDVPWAPGPPRHQGETVQYNPFARDVQTNPFPVYRWLRDEAPVYHNPEIGFYALSRFDDVLQAHLDPPRSSRRTASPSRGTTR